MISRRRLLWLGGGVTVFLPTAARPTLFRDVVNIDMGGRNNGAHVWFDPIGLHVEVGQTIRWTNNDIGNSHTTTAYHPLLYDRLQRIPEGAVPWNSDYLLPGESFEVTLTVPGVYDYYCIPHEHAGMVGRIIVRDPGGISQVDILSEGDVPEIAVHSFPDVEKIMAERTVRAPVENRNPQ